MYISSSRKEPYAEEPRGGDKQSRHFKLIDRHIVILKRFLKMGYLLNALLLLCWICQIHANAGFIHMSNDVDERELEECSMFNPKFKPYPTDLDDPTKKSRIVDIYPSLGCNASDYPEDYLDKIVITKRNNCTFAERAKIVQNGGGAGVIVVSDSGLITPSGNDSDYDEINISVSLITNESYQNFHALMSVVGAEHVFVQLYAPEQKFWDPNAAVMWALAVFTCSLGAWLQGSVFIAAKIAQSAPRPSGSADGKDKKKDDDLQLTVVHAIVFFCMCSVSILLMYFFYDYLVYVIIAIFCMASCASSFDLLCSVFETSACFTRYRIPSNRIPILKTRPPVLAVVLFLCCAAFAVFWAVNRKASYAWILQDILGFTFCVQMIKQIHLPSYKISCILLILFFIYDIFYVFVTPLLTKKGESIMVDIATGGGGTSKEELPMLFKLPRFMPSPYAKCGAIPYSMLGYGDIILPGLHVGFCAVWDLRISGSVRRHLYFTAAVFGYSLGIILTYVGMYIMMMGQPALLYLTPCCLISTLVVGLTRGEVKSLWRGAAPTSVQVVPQDISSSEEDALLDRRDA